MVRKHPQPRSLRFILDDRGADRYASEDDLRMRSEIVIPGRVPRSPGIGRNDDDAASIVKVDDRVAPPNATLRTLRLEHRGGEHEGRGEVATGGS